MTFSPGEYASSWGIVGALVFVIVVLAAIVYSVFVKGTTAAAARDRLFMDFVDGHATKTVVAMGDLSNAIQKGDERIAGALESQAKMLHAVLVAWEALQRARLQKAGGKALTPDEIERIVTIAHDVTRRSLT